MFLFHTSKIERPIILSLTRISDNTQSALINSWENNIVVRIQAKQGLVGNCESFYTVNRWWVWQHSHRKVSKFIPSFFFWKQYFQLLTDIKLFSTLYYKYHFHLFDELGKAWSHTHPKSNISKFKVKILNLWMS